jgi:putative salt-induced outer membrane protein YdiY
VFEKYHWDKNRFAGIASRHEISLGVGRTLWKTPSNALTFELAPGFISEERIGSRTRDFASSRVYSKYIHTFSPTANFSQDAEYLQNLQNTGDLRLNTETAVTATLTSKFSIKCSYVWKHASEPPPSFIKDDTITSIALIANF